MGTMVEEELTGYSIQSKSATMARARSVVPIRATIMGTPPMPRATVDPMTSMNPTPISGPNQGQVYACLHFYIVDQILILDWKPGYWRNLSMRSWASLSWFVSGRRLRYK